MNSSNEAPALDGNTEASKAAPKSKQKAERRHWILTISWPEPEKNVKGLELWLRKHCERYIFQIEKGESGFIHLQLALTLHKKKRLTWLKTHLHRDAHCEITRNEEAAFTYCMKEESRLKGPWVYPEPPTTIRDPLEGKTLYPWQQQIKDIIATEPDARTIHWYWEPNGKTGKTHFAKHLWLHHDVCFLQNSKKSDLAYAYNGERIVVLNLPRTSEDFVSYDAIESLKDGMIFSSKYESGAKVFDNPHLIVFANFPPETSKLSEDRWNIIEID